MVNFGLNSASILGIFLAVGGAGLYFMRSFRPELSRDHDIFFAAIGLLCGFILIFQGWRLDPILQFGQFLLAASVVFFAVETVRLRGATTEQARRTSPRSNDNDDDYRPITNAYTYTAELDELESADDYPSNRRLRGTTRRNDDYDPEPPRRRATPPRSTTTPPPESRPKRPSSRPERPESRLEDKSEGRSEGRNRRNDWDEPTAQPREDWDETPSSRRPSRRPRNDSPPQDYEAPSTSWQEEEPETRPRRRRPQSAEDARSSSEGRTPPRREVSPPEDYIDFQPVDSSPISPTSEEENEDQPRGSEY